MRWNQIKNKLIEATYFYMLQGKFCRGAELLKTSQKIISKIAGLEI